MEKSLGYIKDKPQDFRVCKYCSCINWYENKECWNCNSEDFRELEEDDINCEIEFLMTNHLIEV